MANVTASGKKMKSVKKRRQRNVIKGGNLRSDEGEKKKKNRRQCGVTAIFNGSSISGSSISARNKRGSIVAKSKEMASGSRRKVM